jgi:predicted acyl esterase
MVIERDAPIYMDDGLQLRADVFRPIGQLQRRRRRNRRSRS